MLPQHIDHTHKEKTIVDRIKAKSKQMDTAKATMEVMTEAYGQAARMQQILGWRMVITAPSTNKRNRNHNTKKPRRLHQMQYLVEWAPSHIEKWALPHFAKAGYHPDPDRPPVECSRDNMIDEECTCEICWNADSLADHTNEDHGDMPICDTCGKTYHMACIAHCEGLKSPETDK